MSFAQRLTRDIILSESIFDFANENHDIWESYHNEPHDGHLLVDALIYHPAHLISNGVTANYLSAEQNLGTTYLCRGPHMRGVKRVCQSYGADEIVSLVSAVIKYGRLPTALKDVNRLYNKISSVEELLQIKYEGIKIGDLVYNTYLRSSGLGTFDGNWMPIFKHLLRAVLYTRAYSAVLEKQDIRAVLTSDIQYLTAGVLVRLAVANGATVYARKLGTGAFTLRRYEDPGSIRQSELRPDADLVEHVWKNHRKKATAQGAEYIQDRIHGEVTDSDVQAAYGSQNTKTTGSSEIPDQDSDRPNVVIMSHVFNDAPHSHRGMLYPDYETWIRDTVQTAADIENINWFVKPHPAASRYNTQYTVNTVVADELEGQSDHTVAMLPEEINTTEVYDIADGFVTVRGTIGLEASNFGIPVVTAGPNRYSGFGFTRTADSIENYHQLLESKNTFEPLTDEEIERAQLLTYIQHVLFPVEAAFVPEMERHGGVDQESAWETATRLIRKQKPKDDPLREGIHRFEAESFTHLFNYDAVDWR